MNQNTKQKAYQKVKEMFAEYIYTKKGNLDANVWDQLAEHLWAKCYGACILYEEIFEEEFTLTTEDRHEILGVQEYECEDFIRDIFREKNCKGIEYCCFWDMAEKAGLWKRGTYAGPMSKALSKLTKVVSHHDEDGNWIYNAFELA